MTFKQVGLESNTKKTQAMVCMPGKIRTQLMTDLYQLMWDKKGGGQVGNDWEAQMVECQKCNNTAACASTSLVPTTSTRKK